MFVPLTPIRFLHRAMDLFGHKVGVVCGDKEFRYAEFGDRCGCLASALRSHGIEEADRVAYLSFNTHKLLEGYYGVVQAKAIVMPINVRLAPLEIIGILGHSGARMLLYEKDFEPLIPKLRAACPEVKRYVSLSEEKGEADLTYEELLCDGKPERADIMSFDENSVAELFYTSGSTGVPKGVALTHRTVYLHGLSVALLITEPETAVNLHTIPLFHANGWGYPQASTLLGVKQVMVRRFDPAGVLQLIQQHRATDMSVVPTMANALVNVPNIKDFDVSSLRNVMIGGAAASPELVQRVEQALGCRCVAGYGLTETAPVVTCSLPKSTVTYADEADRYRRQAMAGWPVVGVEVRVVDSGMRDVPRDMAAVGEVVVRGDHVMEGYYKDPEGTAAAMNGGWLHTGDMAVWDDEGYIHIVDRKKEIIISGGENISSIEVEKAIFAHPEVYECAVVAAPDEKWGEAPAAIVVRKPGSTLTAEQLLDFLKDRIARFKLPKIVEFSEEQLPKTGTGKIRKLILKEKFWAGKTRRVQG